MRTLLLLLALLGIPLVATAQDADAAEGAVIDAVEVSGFPRDELSPGLRRDIDELAGTPLERERLNALASRIEGEQPEIVAAVRAIARPDGRARVIFLVARISDDTTLAENINARYVVESVEIAGASGDVSQELRDDLQKLVGRRLDTNEADRLSDRLEAELPGRGVERRISRGTRPGTISVVFEVVERPWIRFAPSRSKIVYHADQGWSGALDIPLSGSRARHRFTVGLAFGNNDDLIEEYSGFRLRFESRTIGTEKLGASLEVARLNQSWEEATLAALGVNLNLPEAYRSRLTVEPMATFAFSPNVRVTTGLSVTELESLARSPISRMANAWAAGVSADHAWDRTTGGHQRVAAGYQLRAARDVLGSDLEFTRHIGQARYQYDRGHSTVIASFSGGSITGHAPLFERFSLGDSTTLRGWNKYDLAPAGGDRMFHQSLEYRFHALAVFFDTGSVWERNAGVDVRYSTGFGVHSDGGFVTLAFPLNAGSAGATFMMGARF